MVESLYTTWLRDFGIKLGLRDCKPWGLGLRISLIRDEGV